MTAQWVKDHSLKNVSGCYILTSEDGVVAILNIRTKVFQCDHQRRSVQVEIYEVTLRMKDGSHVKVVSAHGDSPRVCGCLPRDPEAVIAAISEAYRLLTYPGLPNDAAYYASAFACGNLAKA